MDKLIADRLQKFRKQNGYSQEELADMLNVSRQAVSKWECGESSPDTENLIALAKIYNVTIDQLINGNSATYNKEDTNGVTTASSQSQNTNNTNGKVEDEYSNLSAKQKLILSIVGGSSALVATIIYLCLGFCLYLWHPAWIIFMIIPIVPSLADAIVMKKSKHFAFPVLVSAVYLLVGFLTNLWHPAWIIFLSIPLYYVFVDSITLYKSSKDKTN